MTATGASAAHTEGMPSEGTVREWSGDRGTGVIDSGDTPGGCWVHFSNIVTDGLGTLTPGDRVTFTHEALRQDGFGYRAVLVWPPDVEPGTSPPRANDGPSAAYQSTLTIRWADGTVTTRSGDDPLPFSGRA
jgi:cold shock protein